MKIVFKQRLLIMLAVVLVSLSYAVQAAPARFYFEIKVYHYKTAQQEGAMDAYFKTVYMQAVKKITGEPVGVFKSLASDTDKRFYVFIPFKTWAELAQFDARLAEDAQFTAAATGFTGAAYDAAPYTRMETIILHAFPKWPAPTAPKLSGPKTDRIYELRSYESPTEQLHVNKVKMFNDGGETVLFNRLNFNAVFYAQVIAGSHMPNLMYMTTFNDKADRDKHWDTFSNDPQWKILVAMPEYQHNVSKADIIFLHPTEYSDY